MRLQDIEVGKSYRLRTSPTYGWVEIIKKLKPKQKENINSFSIVKVRHTVHKNDNFGFFRYFKPHDIVK